MASRRLLCLVAVCGIGNALLAPTVPGCSLTNCRAKSGGFGATTNKAPSKKTKAKAFTKKQAQLEAEFESLSDAARTVEARTEDVSRLAAQFATLVDEQHDQVVTLDGLVGDTANQVDKAGDHVAQAASRRATLPRGQIKGVDDR